MKRLQPLVLNFSSASTPVHMTESVIELMVCGWLPGGAFIAESYLSPHCLLKTQDLSRYFGKYLLARKVR